MRATRTPSTRHLDHAATRRTKRVPVAARPALAGIVVAVVTGVAGLPAPSSAAPGTARPDGAEQAAPGPVDRTALRRTLASVPDAHVTAAQLRVSGSRGRALGRFAGRGGVADLLTGRPVPARGRFRIASGTKMFTAALVLQLAGERRLDLAAPVQRYLPRLLPTDYPDIPVRSLLDHTSGLPHSTEDDGNEDAAHFVAHRFDTYTPRQVLATATTQPMEFPPGAAQSYNGVNYFVAGLLVEAVTSHSYAHELRHRILGPLRLRDTSLPAPRHVRIPGPHAHSYLNVNGVPVDVTAQSPYGWAESGLVSTTADLTRFLVSLLDGRVVRPPEQRLLFDVPDVAYRGDDCGPGPDPRACYSAGLTRTVLPGGVTVWGKSGSVPGTSSGTFATRDLGRVLSYAVHPLGNRDGSEGALLQRVVTAAFGLSGPPDQQPRTHPSPGRAAR